MTWRTLLINGARSLRMDWYICTTSENYNPNRKECCNTRHRTREAAERHCAELQRRLDAIQKENP